MWRRLLKRFNTPYLLVEYDSLNYQYVISIKRGFIKRYIKCSWAFLMDRKLGLEKKDRALCMRLWSVSKREYKEISPEAAGRIITFIDRARKL